MRLTISRMLFKLTDWSRKVSFFVGGCMAIGVPIALLFGIFGDGSRTWPDAWGGHKAVSPLETAWHGAILLIGAYVVLYLLVPAVLARLAWIALPAAERAAYLEAEFEYISAELKAGVERDYTAALDTSVDRDAH